MAKGNIRISLLQKTKDDNSFIQEDAVLIRITNQGQNYLWIDEQEVLLPGESWIEGDLNGPGIDHAYSLKFIDNPAPPAVDKPLVYPGNFINIRVFKRPKHA